MFAAMLVMAFLLPFGSVEIEKIIRQDQLKKNSPFLPQYLMAIAF